MVWVRMLRRKRRGTAEFVEDGPLVPSAAMYVSDGWLRVADYVDLFLTVLSCALYVATTYIEGTRHVKKLGKYMWCTEVLISSGLLLIYLLRLWSSHNHGRRIVEYVLAKSSLLDLGTSLPVLISLLFLRDVAQHRQVRMLRILRVLRTFHLSAEVQMQPVAHQATVVALTLVSVVFISAGAFPLLDEPPASSLDDTSPSFGMSEEELLAFPYLTYPFHDALYFVIITITTVGYGDISPQTAQARLASVLMVATTFVLLPLQTSKLIEVLAGRDPFRASFRGSERRPHVLICGKVSAQTLRHFEKQLLSAVIAPRPSFSTGKLWRLLRLRRKSQRYAAGEVEELSAWVAYGGGSLSKQPWELQIVVLSPAIPDGAVRALLQSQRSPRRLHWLRGSAASASDLERVDLEHAIAAVVLSEERPFSEVADHDTRAVLDALSLRYRQPQLPCIVQLQHHPQAGHLRLLGTRCVLESGPLRLLILAISCECPGASTLLFNLLQPAHAYTNLAASKSLAAWQREYLSGALQRLQRLPVPRALEGAPPALAVLRAFKEAGTVLLARAPLEEEPDTRLELMLSSNRPLQKGEVLFVIRCGSHTKSTFKREKSSFVAAGTRSPSRRGSRSVTRSRDDLIPRTLSIASAFAAATTFVPLPMRRNPSSNRIATEAEEGVSPTRMYHRLGDVDETQDEPGAFAPPRRATLADPPSHDRKSLPTGSQASSSLRRIKVKRLNLLDDKPLASLSVLAAQRLSGTSHNEDSHMDAESVATGAATEHDREPDAHAATQRRGAFHIPGRLLHHRTTRGNSPVRNRAQSSNSNQADQPPPTTPPKQWPLPAPIAPPTDDVPIPPPPSDLKGHVLLCGLPPYTGALRDFVSPLRCAARFPAPGNCPAVLLLQPSPPGHDACRAACSLGEVFFLQGRCEEMADLLRAGIDRASYVVLPRSVDMTSVAGRMSSEDHHPVYEDAATILICREIESSPELQALPIAEVAHSSNMDFLLPHVDDDISADAALHVTPMLSPYFAAGRVLSPALVNAMLCSVVRHFHLPDLLEELLIGTPGYGCLLQWAIPEEFLDATYGEVFECFVAQRNAIPLGLLRGGTAIGSPLPYVLSNPPALTQLLPDDMIFVVGNPLNEPWDDDGLSEGSGRSDGPVATRLREALSVPLLPSMPPLEPTDETAKARDAPDGRIGGS